MTPRNPRFFLIPALLLFATILSLACMQAPKDEAITPAQYEKNKTAIQAYRSKLIAEHKGAAAQKTLHAKARKYIVDQLEHKLIPAWYGTPWDFNGTSTVPGSGHIACGYFVTTLLRDVGFKVERVRMAQQASLNIIRSITPRDQIRDYGGIKVPTLVKRLSAMPEGIYVVGLDIHTGFIVNRPGEVLFIHASYGDPAVVVREKALESAVLAQSNRFVLGQVDNDWFVGKWLSGAAITTVR